MTLLYFELNIYIPTSARFLWRFLLDILYLNVLFMERQGAKISFTPKFFTKLVFFDDLATEKITTQTSSKLLRKSVSRIVTWTCLLSLRSLSKTNSPLHNSSSNWNNNKTQIEFPRRLLGSITAARKLNSSSSPPSPRRKQFSRLLFARQMGEKKKP